MNEYQHRKKLMDGGKTWEEAEDELSDMASDAYDRWKDEQAERLVDERDNNVRSKT
jgi:hypothetical protein